MERLVLSYFNSCLISRNTALDLEASAEKERRAREICQKGMRTRVSPLSKNTSMKPADDYDWKLRDRRMHHFDSSPLARLPHAARYKELLKDERLIDDLYEPDDELSMARFETTAWQAEDDRPDLEGKVFSEAEFYRAKYLGLALPHDARTWEIVPKWWLAKDVSYEDLYYHMGFPAADTYPQVQLAGMILDSWTEIVSKERVSVASWWLAPHSRWRTPGFAEHDLPTSVAGKDQVDLDQSMVNEQVKEKFPSYFTSLKMVNDTTTTVQYQSELNGCIQGDKYNELRSKLKKKIDAAWSQESLGVHAAKRAYLAMHRDQGTDMDLSTI